MLINRISQNTYFTPYKQICFAKKQPKNQVDTFERQKEPYSVENSIDAFSAGLAALIKNKNCDRATIRTLVRQFVPRTKVEDNRAELEISDDSAAYIYETHISNNNKIHYPYKKIMLDLNKKDEQPSDFFNDLVHEMVHNLQTNKEKKIYNKIYSDFFEDSLETNSAFKDLFDTAADHGEQMIGENYNKNLELLKYLESQNYEIKKSENINKFKYNPELRNRAEQVYDLSVLTTLSQEEQAYTIADAQELKYFKKPNKRANQNKQLFKDLKDIVLYDLRKTGMSEEKIEEYKKLIMG